MAHSHTYSNCRIVNRKRYVFCLMMSLLIALTASYRDCYSAGPPAMDPFFISSFKTTTCKPSGKSPTGSVFQYCPEGQSLYDPDKDCWGECRIGHIGYAPAELSVDIMHNYFLSQDPILLAPITSEAVRRLSTEREFAISVQQTASFEYKIKEVLYTATNASTTITAANNADLANRILLFNKNPEYDPKNGWSLASIKKWISSNPGYKFIGFTKITITGINYAWR